MQAKTTEQTSNNGDHAHHSPQSTGRNASIKDNLRGLPFAEQQARLSPGRQATGESAILGGGAIGGRTARPRGLEADDAESGYVMPEIDEDALGPVSDYEPFPPLAAPGGASTPADAIEGYAGIVMGGNPPGFGMLGKTVATANGLMPPRFDINVEEIDGQFVARIKPTTTHDALHEAVATTPGFFEDRPVEAEILKKGGPGYRYYLEVTEAMSALVFQGEQEHLDDCLLAYERVCLAAGDAINVIAAKPEGFSAATAEEAKSNLDAALLEALPAELRRLPRDIGKYGNFVQDVFGKTMVYRDKRGLHSMTRKFQFKSKKTKELISEAIPSSTVSIGQVSSDTVVTDAIATAEII